MQGKEALALALALAFSRNGVKEFNGGKRKLVCYIVQHICNFFHSTKHQSITMILLKHMLPVSFIQVP